MVKKFISVVSAAAIVLSSASAMGIPENSASAEDVLKIMCIGDSITDGYVSEYAGSYRKFIYHELTEMGYSVDMVGAKDGGWTPTYTDEETGETWEFDNENTGYSGYSIISYSGRTGIYETLQSTGCLSAAPDVVTLQIGTNDVIDNHEMDKAPERLEILVDYILDNIPSDSTLFLSTIPYVDPNRSEVYDWFGNYRHSADWQEQYSDEEAETAVIQTIDDYNLAVRFLAEKKQVEGKKVVLSDAPEMIKDVSTQLFDGVHPNNSGYKAMGKQWAAVINDELIYQKANAGTSTEPPAVTTSTAEPIVTTVSEIPAVTTAVYETTADTETQTVTTSSVAETTAVVTTTVIPENPEETPIKVMDLVKISRYVMGNPYEFDFSQEDISRFDVDKDGRIDVFDVVAARKLLIETGKKLTEKGFSLFPDGDNSVTPAGYDPDAEPERVQASSSGSSSITVSVSAVITEIEDDDDSYIIDWIN